MYSFKTNPKNRRSSILFLLLFIFVSVVSNFFSLDKTTFISASVIFVAGEIFLYFEGKATLTITDDNYIYDYFGKKNFPKQNYKLRADGHVVSGFRDNRVTFYRLRLIHADTYEKAQEIRMSMSSKEYEKHIMALKKLGEFN